MKPVYIINGFLESGKTEFITYTLDQPYFQIRGKTLIVLCEDGENEYDPALLKRSNSVLELIGKLALLVAIAFPAYEYSRRLHKAWRIIFWIALVIYVLGCVLGMLNINIGG